MTEKSSKKLQAIILDFDGVILESTNVKTWAFAELFKDYPEHVDQIVKYHLDHGGVSRYEKFEHIYKNILKKPLSKSELASLSKRFSDIVFSKILSCDFVSGALEFLKKYHNTTTLFIVSATPHEEINDIVEKLNIRKYFHGVYGSPHTKAELVKKILRENKLRPQNVLFVGDQMSDYNVAKHLGLQFVGRIHKESANFRKMKGIKTIKNVWDLIDFLEKDKNCDGV